MQKRYKSTYDLNHFWSQTSRKICIWNRNILSYIMYRYMYIPLFQTELMYLSSPISLMPLQFSKAAKWPYFLIDGWFLQRRLLRLHLGTKGWLYYFQPAACKKNQKQNVISSRAKYMYRRSSHKTSSHRTNFSIGQFCLI